MIEAPGKSWNRQTKSQEILKIKWKKQKDTEILISCSLVLINSQAARCITAFSPEAEIERETGDLIDTWYPRCSHLAVATIINMAHNVYFTSVPVFSTLKTKTRTKGIADSYWSFTCLCLFRHCGLHPRTPARRRRQPGAIPPAPATATLPLHPPSALPRRGHALHRLAGLRLLRILQAAGSRHKLGSQSHVQPRDHHGPHPGVLGLGAGARRHLSGLFETLLRGVDAQPEQQQAECVLMEKAVISRPAASFGQNYLCQTHKQKANLTLTDRDQLGQASLGSCNHVNHFTVTLTFSCFLIWSKYIMHHVSLLCLCDWSYSIARQIQIVSDAKQTLIWVLVHLCCLLYIFYYILIKIYILHWGLNLLVSVCLDSLEPFILWFNILYCGLTWLRQQQCQWHPSHVVVFCCFVGFY